MLNGFSDAESIVESVDDQFETLQICDHQHHQYMLPSRINLEFKRLVGLAWLIISSPQQKVIVFGLG